MTYRAPKRDISRSGLRSWMRRHPVFGQRLPPGRELAFLFTKVHADFLDALRASMAMQPEEWTWFRDVTLTDPMQGKA